MMVWTCCLFLFQRREKLVFSGVTASSNPWERTVVSRLSSFLDLFKVILLLSTMVIPTKSPFLELKILQTNKQLEYVTSTKKPQFWDTQIPCSALNGELRLGPVVSSEILALMKTEEMIPNLTIIFFQMGWGNIRMPTKLLSFSAQKSLEDILNHSSFRGIFSKRACQLLPNRYGFSPYSQGCAWPSGPTLPRGPKIAVERKVMVFHPSVGLWNLERLCFLLLAIQCFFKEASYKARISWKKRKMCIFMYFVILWFLYLSLIRWSMFELGCVWFLLGRTPGPT